MQTPDLSASIKGNLQVTVATNLNRHIRNESLAQGIGNIIANALIAWLLLRNRDALALWSFDGVALDIALTCLLLLTIVSWIVMASQKRQLKAGKLATIAPNPDSSFQRLLLTLPESTWKAAACIGLFGLLVVAPLTLLGFELWGVQSIAPMHYVVFKGLWTGTLALLIVSPCTYAALLRR